jgi:hypothetical protein
LPGRRHDHDELEHHQLDDDVEHDADHQQHDHDVDQQHDHDDGGADPVLQAVVADGSLLHLCPRRRQPVRC